MSLSVVWLDRQNAKIFNFSEEKMERVNLHDRHQDHHTHRLDQDEKESPKFYDEVCSRILAAAKILILGPGVGKTHLKAHLEKKFPALGLKVVGCQSVDHPTDDQIASIAREYFHMGAK